MGNFRAVYSVDSLSNGIKPKIVVKSPEKTFTKDGNLLDKGYPWWGGPRSTENKISIYGNPVVEIQAVWEAIILLQLNSHGIQAEIPQALIENRDGSRELVVNEIDTSHRGVEIRGRSPTLDAIRTQTDLQPAQDWDGHNLLYDSVGQVCIIDVNRWSWPPYTDNFRRRLLQVIYDTGKH